MEITDLVGLVFRSLHILAAITAVGGTIFARFVVLPSDVVLSEADRAKLHTAMRARWSKIVAASIGFLLVSGLVNVALIEATTTAPKEYVWYRPLLGIKFLLALVIFVLASLLSGKTAAAEKLRRNARFWMNVNIALAVTLVCISGVMSKALKIKKPPKTPLAVVASADLHQENSWSERRRFAVRAGLE